MPARRTSEADGGSSQADRERALGVARQWTRIGALFTTVPAAGPVDLERLIVATAAIARTDERLFVMAASWLAEHHQLVDVRRLCQGLVGVTDETSAVTGAMLAMAFQDTPSPPPLAAAHAQCRPLAAHALLFPVVAEIRGMPEVVRAEALPLFAAWGFWHNDAVLKRPAIRPLQWILQHCEELRYRAVEEADGDAEREVALAVVRLIDQVEQIVRESGDPDGFNAEQWVAQFLDAPSPALGGRRPRDFMETSDGRTVVAALVAQMQSGAYG